MRVAYLREMKIPFGRGAQSARSFVNLTPVNHKQEDRSQTNTGFSSTTAVAFGHLLGGHVVMIGKIRHHRSL